MTSKVRFWNGADQQFQMIDLTEVARAATEFMYIDYESVADYCAYHRLSRTDKKKLVEKLLADGSFFTVPGKDPLNPMPLARIILMYNLNFRIINKSTYVIYRVLPDIDTKTLVNLKTKVAYSMPLKVTQSIQDFINETITALNEQKESYNESI